MVKRRVALIITLLIAACGGGGASTSVVMAAQPTTHQLHFILRPDAAGRWYVQDDDEHKPVGVAPFVDQTDTMLAVHFTRPYRYAGTVQISSDNDYLGRVNGHASLGLNRVVIFIAGDGKLIDPARAPEFSPPGVGGNLWVNITMVD